MIPTEDNQVEQGRVDSSLASPCGPSVFSNPSFPLSAFLCSLPCVCCCILSEMSPTTGHYLNPRCPADSASLTDCVPYRRWRLLGEMGL